MAFFEGTPEGRGSHTDLAAQLGRERPRMGSRPLGASLPLLRPSGGIDRPMATATSRHGIIHVSTSTGTWVCHNATRQF